MVLFCSGFCYNISQATNSKKCFFAKCQEGAKKDVERAFGVLQARWGIVKQPARSWHLDRVHTFLMACIVLHNMIIEDEMGEEHAREHEDFRVEAGPLVRSCPERTNAMERLPDNHKRTRICC